MHKKYTNVGIYVGAEPDQSETIQREVASIIGKLYARQQKAFVLGDVRHIKERTFRGFGNDVLKVSDMLADHRTYNQIKDRPSKTLNDLGLDALIIAPVRYAPTLAENWIKARTRGDFETDLFFGNKPDTPRNFFYDAFLSAAAYMQSSRSNNYLTSGVYQGVSLMHAWEVMRDRDENPKAPETFAVDFKAIPGLSF